MRSTPPQAGYDIGNVTGDVLFHVWGLELLSGAQ
jgi:hypothetical protein